MTDWGPELETRWSAWLVARNRRATMVSLYFNAALYPLFGILDYFLAPHAWLWLLWGTRALVLAVTICLFRVVRTDFFTRHGSVVSASYHVMLACGISLMTGFLGGLASPYYAGLSLGLLGIGLLFVWPNRVVVATHTAIVASFVLPNWLLGHTGDPFAAVSNLFFLISTALIAMAGQLLAYRTNREQVTNQLVIESTKADLERAHLRLQQLDRFKSEFFANVTHELKTPLTMILAPLELMLQGEMGKVSEPQRASLQSMLRNGVKLLKLIGDLLDLSKLDESRLRLQVASHDIVGFLSDLVAQIQSLAQRKSIDLKFESNVRESIVHCDIERLERVFVNLLSNAAKFTPAGGNIVLSVHDTGPNVQMEVSDTGIGFPPEMAEQLFQRFFQVDRAKTRKFGGTGIGLALAKELVLLHGGRIEARSDGSGGATFVVELVKDRDHFKPDHVDRRARKEDRPSGSRVSDYGVGEWEVAAKGQFRFIDIDEATDQRVLSRDIDEGERLHSVLVVEDTPDVIRVIHLALRSQFRVLAARDGVQGLELAIKYLPDLVITDFMMPEMDGMELTKRLRAERKTRHIPVIMLTARGDLDDRVAGLQSGVNAYLTKPFSGKELVSAVRGLLKIQETTADLLLKENMDSLETIAGGLAHEINNPLNYLKNGLALIREDARALAELVSTHVAQRDEEVQNRIAIASERMSRMFEVAETGIRRIGATVTLMQRYSRDGYTRTIQPFDLFEAVRDVVSMLEAGTPKNRVETSFEGQGAIECVPEELNQVLTNLIQNALDAIPPDTGRVRVTGHVEDSQLVLSVADNGSGIPPEVRSRIFAPFYTTKDVGAGMGLGLTIVHRVITSLGGTITVTSNVGVGTTFALRLPLTQPTTHPDKKSIAQRTAL